MADDTPTTRDLKLIQYLNEAYGKEKELETALKSHIAMTTRDTYKKRLKEHLAETRSQAKGLERRIKQLGGKAELVDLPVPAPAVATEAAGKVVAAAKKGTALAKGPLHAVRGTGESEKQLKNAKTELANEWEEIGTYLAIEELATAVYDAETATLARAYRRQEERMAAFLQKLIPQLTKQVARDEIPAAERRPATVVPTRTRASTARRAAAATATSTPRKPSGRSSSSRRTATAA